MSWDRLLGKHGILYLGTAAAGSTVFDGADLYNIEVNIESDTEELEGLDDSWGQPKPRVYRWSVRAEKWVATADFLTIIPEAITAGTVFYVSVFRGGDTAAGAILCSGAVTPTRASFALPNGGMNESLELQGVGAPTIAST